MAPGFDILGGVNTCIVKANDNVYGGFLDSNDTLNLTIIVVNELPTITGPSTVTVNNG